MNWTPDQHHAYVNRRAAVNRPGKSFLPDDQMVGENPAILTIQDEVKYEKELHRQIAQECHRRGWIAFHGSMASRSHRTIGECDFTILGLKDESLCHQGLNFERKTPFVLFVECKRHGGKLSEDQFRIIEQAKSIGHTIHVVTSFQQFLKLL